MPPLLSRTQHEVKNGYEEERGERVTSLAGGSKKEAGENIGKDKRTAQRGTTVAQ